MTIEKLLEILGLPSPAETVKELQNTSYPDLPKWSDLINEYDPMKHSIWDEAKYPPKLNTNQQDEFKRTALGLQKLAVNRIAQSMFSTPTTRKYNYKRDNESAQKAVDIMEEVYRTQNKIDSENIERAKKLNASCQIVTVWNVYERENIIEGETSKLKLAHTTYSPIDGYELYPINDPNGELLVLSIGYKDTDDVEFMAVYINIQDNYEFRLYANIGKWKLAEIEGQQNPAKLEVFPVVYANISEPVWGGEAGTNKVEQLEEMESYQGMYIKRNALPTFTLDYGEVRAGAKDDETEETTEDVRRIIRVGKGGKMTDVTWEGAEAAVTSRYARIRNAFFEEIQVPDTSFANMVASNTSAENKELIFTDAKAKAKDLGGEWESLFYEELKIVMAFVKIMFVSTKAELEMMSVRSVINPYSMRTKKENSEYISTAGGSMSQATKVGILAEVDDINAEVEQIESENSASVNQGLF